MNSDQLPMHPRYIKPVLRIRGRLVKRPSKQHPNPMHLMRVKRARNALQRDPNGQIYCATCWEVDSPSRPLEVHHRHYDTWGEEKPGDVVLLCPDCHDVITQRYTDKRLSIAEEAIRAYFFPGKSVVH